MASLAIYSNCEKTPWTDYAGERLVPGQLERVGLMPHGTVSGRPALLIGIRSDDNTHVMVAQTTWAIWQAVMRSLSASPVAELERLDDEGQEHEDLETLTTAYENRLRAEGMRQFASYLEKSPSRRPARPAAYALLAREQAKQVEAGGHAS